jgi:hypothetical protein
MWAAIPSGAIIPLFIAAFVIQAFQYYRIDPDRRLLNLPFSMMFGAVALTFAEIAMPQWSLVFFLLALFWFAFSIYLLRFLPPPKH